ncbi:MAG: peptide deformylase [Coxiella sp. RIFCSPHIGHO2_12_FULL_42_15]|nr:MAG: peptide deformylase [Coxiella sp. RIFCSPHIGHO2_12_FULL_42_15]
MTVLRILQYPDPRLKMAAHKVETFDNALQKIIDDMFETHYQSENCAALAATQLDLVDPPHITVIDFSVEKNQPLCLINAEITHHEGETYEEEGCMSVGHDRSVYAKVKRAKKISVRAQDRYGKPFEFDADGFMAKCIQHELDHLIGKLYIEHLSPLKRQRLLIKLKKSG